nr:MAG TPA: lysozyme family protein [Caudoviricetes sp.]
MEGSLDGRNVRRASFSFGTKTHQAEKSKSARGDYKMSKTESAILWMESKAKDDRHGYDQIYRWGEKGDYDCSSAVICAWEQAGVPVKSTGATYTGNMLSIFKKCGFKDVTSKVNLATGAGLLRGDVLLNTKHHTAMYCGRGKEVEASINEKKRATGGAPGDQTGKEFLIRSYRNYPWNHVLRYQEGSSLGKGACFQVLRKGSSGSSVKTMQQMLIACGYPCGSFGADGKFGNATYAALIAFQRAAGVITDGEYGSQTKSKLTEVYHKKM